MAAEAKPVVRSSWHVQTLNGTTLEVTNSVQYAGEPFETRYYWQVPATAVATLVADKQPQVLMYDSKGLRPMEVQQPE